MRVFLTGATSGIGEALARLYARQGATLGLYARREGELARVQAALGPTRAVAYAGDVRDAEALARAGEDFIARFGAPDIVIANAGVSSGALTEERVDLPVFRDIFDTNILGIVHTFAPFIAAMREARAGVLVGIASVAGARGLPGAGAYCASKAAAITYLESLRVELRGSGVAVVTICPGFIATPLTARNPYRMPFLLQPDRAARLMAAAIAGRRKFYVLPWQMAWAMRLLWYMPRWLYDPVVAGRKRKPRDAG